MANGTPFSLTTPQPPSLNPTQQASIQGIAARSGGVPQDGAPVASPPQDVPGLFVALTDAIVKAGLTPEVLSSFQDFIAFFQQIVQQAQGGAPAGPPGQALPQGPPPGAPPGPPPLGAAPGAPPAGPGVPLG